MGQPGDERRSHEDRPDQGGWWRRIASAALFALFVAAVTVYYVFVVSAGLWTRWPAQTTYYDSQADGFREGHLYTTIQPAPTLLELPDPLNPANSRHWNWDYSYYRGHIYLYWGLLPALLLAAAKALLRMRAPVGDEVLVFAFLLGRAIVGGLLIRGMARRLRPFPPGWAVALAMIVFAVANPTPFLLARGAVYEASLSGGSMFLIAGLSASMRAIFAETPVAAGCWLAAGSLFFGASGTCRDGGSRRSRIERENPANGHEAKWFTALR